MKRATVRGVHFISDDAQSCAPRERLRSDALAFALATVTERNVAASPQTAEVLKTKVCVVDPNVSYLMVNMGRFSLGPVDDMRRAWVICIPIANFDVETPEGGYHWTMLVLQKQPASATPCCWLQPIHIDSATSCGGSDNSRFAQRAAQLIVAGLAELESEEKRTKVSPVFIEHGASNTAARPTAAMSVQLLEGTPRQGNGYDCGIFAALAAGTVMGIIADRVQQASTGDSTLGMSRSLFAGSFSGAEVNWRFDQAAATEFKAMLYREMTASLK